LISLFYLQLPFNLTPVLSCYQSLPHSQVSLSLSLCKNVVTFVVCVRLRCCYCLLSWISGFVDFLIFFIAGLSDFYLLRSGADRFFPFVGKVFIFSVFLIVSYELLGLGSGNCRCFFFSTWSGWR